MTSFVFPGIEVSVMAGGVSAIFDLYPGADLPVIGPGGLHRVIPPPEAP
ncbi:MULTISPECIES: hypothetical protein [Actinomyces]|uniref:Uncharacterized protein n=1 Tax=Actinomyces respiraculi TaxID=2744574 RepID=A0A7T0LM62_9ACTO|nr:MULTISPECIES: hypothetical protein [Actinomyces]QPL06182.1 hypothetical protein ID810_04510 [Actinomyces respiraculi]